MNSLLHSSLVCALRMGLSDPEKRLAWNRALEKFRCQPSLYISEALPSIEDVTSIAPLVIKNDQHRLHKSVGAQTRHRVKVQKARLLIDLNQ